MLWLANLDFAASGEETPVVETRRTQERRHASFRAISGTSSTYEGDAMAAMALELEAAELPVPSTFNGRLLAWLQLRLSSSDDNLPNLMAAFAEAEGAHNWASVGTFEAMS